MFEAIVAVVLLLDWVIFNNHYALIAAGLFAIATNIHDLNS